MVNFKTDENGNLILKPVMGWEMRHIAASVLILGTSYADNQDELETGLGKSISLVLTLGQAQKLAEDLKTEVSKLSAMQSNLNTVQ